MKNFIWECIGFIIFFVSIMFLISISTGPDFPINECGDGYHWAEGFRGTISGCAKD